MSGVVVAAETKAKTPMSNHACKVGSSEEEASEGKATGVPKSPPKVGNLLLG
jgi:hypothetical protein